MYGVDLRTINCDSSIAHFLLMDPNAISLVLGLICYHTLCRLLREWCRKTVQVVFVESRGRTEADRGRRPGDGGLQRGIPKTRLAMITHL